jgi:1,4-dihydroxy-2-naphthoate octaprenyltransferase
MTAYNSFYDRDEGPVGGLVKPPPVSQALLPFSLLVQLAGALLASLVNLTFLVIYLVIFVMGVAYSYPRIRWKARPLAGLVTVAIGQGVLASLGGWATAQPNLLAVDGIGWLGVMAVTLITVGFYPLTQIYQIDEDQARGDRTFAVWAGPRGAFAFALVAQGLAAVILVILLAWLLSPVEAVLVGLFYGALLLAIAHWARTFDGGRVLANYRRIMGLNRLSSYGFLAFIGLHLFRIL